MQYFEVQRRGNQIKLEARPSFWPYCVDSFVVIPVCVPDPEMPRNLKSTVFHSNLPTFTEHAFWGPSFMCSGFLLNVQNTF